MYVREKIFFRPLENYLLLVWLCDPCWCPATHVIWARPAFVSAHVGDLLIWPPKFLQWSDRKTIYLFTSGGQIIIPAWYSKQCRSCSNCNISIISRSGKLTTSRFFRIYKKQMLSCENILFPQPAYAIEYHHTWVIQSHHILKQPSYLFGQFTYFQWYIHSIVVCCRRRFFCYVVIVTSKSDALSKIVFNLYLCYHLFHSFKSIGQQWSKK